MDSRKIREAFLGRFWALIARRLETLKAERLEALASPSVEVDRFRTLQGEIQVINLILSKQFQESIVKEGTP